MRLYGDTGLLNSIKFIDTNGSAIATAELNDHENEGSQCKSMVKVDLEEGEVIQGLYCSTQTEEFDQTITQLGLILTRLAVTKDRIRHVMVYSKRTGEEFAFVPEEEDQ